MTKDPVRYIFTAAMKETYTHGYALYHVLLLLYLASCFPIAELVNVDYMV